MIDPKTLGFSKQTLSYVLVGPSSYAEEVWEKVEKQVLIECFRLKLQYNTCLELFSSNIISRRIKTSAVSDTREFRDVFDVIYHATLKEYNEWLISDREQLERRLGIKVKNVDIIGGDDEQEPIYKLVLNGTGELSLSANDLMFQGHFRLKFLKFFHRKPEPMEKGDWERLTNYWLENVKTIQSPSVSKHAEVEEYLDEFLSDPIDAGDDYLIRLRKGQVIRYQEGLAFRVEAFRKYLERAKRPVQPVSLFNMLHTWGWEDMRIGGARDRIRCWWRKDEVKTDV